MASSLLVVRIAPLALWPGAVDPRPGPCCTATTWQGQPVRNPRVDPPTLPTHLDQHAVLALETQSACGRLA